MNKNNPPCFNKTTPHSTPHTSKEKEKEKENIKVKEKINTHTNHIVGECEFLFLSLWESYKDIFSNPFIIKNQDYWEQFWDQCPYTKEEIKKAMYNLVRAVRKGFIQRKYISPYPDTFIGGGMFTRGLHDFDYFTYLKKRGNNESAR